MNAISRACWRSLIFVEPLDATTTAALEAFGGSGVMALIEEGQSDAWGLAYASRVYSNARERQHSIQFAVKLAQRAVPRLDPNRVAREVQNPSGRTLRFRQILPEADLLESDSPSSSNQPNKGV